MSTKIIQIEQIYLAGFATNLKTAREHLGLSIKDISSFLRIKPTSYYKYENGTRFPKPYMLLDLLNKYSINLNYLFSGEGDIVAYKNHTCGITSELRELCSLANRHPEVKKVLLAEMDKLKVYMPDKFK